jgi:hypothetical protein
VFQGKRNIFRVSCEILKENSKCKKDSQIPLKFSDPEVEKRSLDVYEIFSQGGFESTSPMRSFTTTCSN